MTQSTAMKSKIASKLFLENSPRLMLSMTSGQCYSKRLLAAQLILMLVTVVFSADTQSAQAHSDSEVLSHSISHPISSDNKNVPYKDTHSHSPPPEQQSSVNLTQVWDDVQKFIASGVNSTASFLDLNKRDAEQQTHKKQEGLQSHQPGQHRVNNHTVHENVTHDTMHEHVVHHHDVGEIQEDSNHEFTIQEENPVETVRLQDILRQIFVDELDSAEHTTEEIDDNGEPSLNDASGRSDLRAQNATKKPHANHYANSTVSRQGRADNNGQSRRRLSKSASKSGSKSKSTDLSKYNKYMDAVLQRMNTMIKSKRMDPLRVNLYAGPSKKKNGNKHKKNSPRMNLDSEEIDAFETDEELDGDREPPSDGPATRDIYLDRDGTTRRIRALLANVNSSTSKSLPLSDEDEDRSISSVESRDGSPSTSRNSPDNGTRALSTGRNKNGSKPANKKNSKENGQKAKGGSNKNKNSPRPTRGILHGLSTLRRDGNVQVLKQSDRSRLVRAKFLLGPVALEILPKKTNPRTGRGGKAAAATATAPQLKGILEVRLKQGSPTRIKRLRVYPPGNVKVAGEGAKQSGPSGGRVTGRGYNKVTPMATYRLRQVAMQVVRHADRLKH